MKQSMLEPASVAATLIHELGIWLYVGGGLALALVVALTLVGAFSAPRKISERKWLIGGGIVFPSVVLLALLAYAIHVGEAISGAEGRNSEVEVVGRPAGRAAAASARSAAGARRRRLRGMLATGLHHAPRRGQRRARTHAATGRVQSQSPPFVGATVASALVRSAHLESSAIVATVERLHRRIVERFPDRGLAEVALDLVRVAHMHEARARSIQRPARGLQVASAALILATLGALVWLLTGMHAERLRWQADDGLEVVQVLEAGLGALVFLGAAVAFLATLELRVKRRRALEALHELRALAHVVDMHQLAKDPERATGRSAPTPASPPADLTPAELSRYLEYCSEMLALLGKIAAFYAQGFPDPVAADAVDDFTLLTTSLSTRIGQKILILDLVDQRS